MTRNAVVFSLLLGCTLAIAILPARGAEIPLSGRFSGYVAVDRWGQKVFHSGTRHLFLSDEAYEKLKDKVGKPLQIDVTKMDQPMNPGSAMILKFSKAQVKPPLEGLELSIDCANKQPQRGNGITIRMTVRNTSKKTIEIYPVWLSMVLVTNKPTSNTSMGYKDPDDCSYWYYQDVYIGLKGGNDIKRVACRKIGLKWISQAMAKGGKGITAFNRSGMDGVAIVPGGNYRGSATIGKLLLPGEYQVFAYCGCGAPGAVSKRIDFDVGEKTARPAKKKSAKITSTQPNAEAASQAELRKIKELAWRLGKRRREPTWRPWEEGQRTPPWRPRVWDVNPLYLKLLKFGKRAVPVLLEVYKDGNPLAKRSVVCALGHLHDPDLRDFFLKATKEEDPGLSTIAHWSLIYLKDRELIPFFLKNLQDPRNPHIRGYAALALAKFQDKSLIKPLRKALRIKDKARREIILALQELNATEAVGDLIEMYYDNPSFEFAPLIVVCVGKLDGKRRVRFLIDCLKNKNLAVVCRALEAMGRTGEKSCIPAVKTLVRSGVKNANVLSSAGATLYRLGDETGLGILARGLEDKWPNRLAYAYELGRLRKKAATGVLLEKLLSKDEIPEDLRRRILQALGETGDKSVLPVLVSSLGKDREGNYWAIKSIEKLTGLDFKCPWFGSATETERKKIVENVRAWWRQHKAQKGTP